MYTAARLTDILREVLFWSALGLAGIATIDWMVRTRRINPFNPLARFFRRTIDPLMAPVERRIVRSGGLPSHAPWWTLAGLIVGGILLLTLIQFIAGIAGEIGYAVNAPTQLPRVLVNWTARLLQLALIVRVVSTWTRLSPYSPWIRWSYTLTEWMLSRLRRVFTPVSGIDLTPIIAYFGIAVIAYFLTNALR